jgi:hypothetical protein
MHRCTAGLLLGAATAATCLAACGGAATRDKTTTAATAAPTRAGAPRAATVVIPRLVGLEQTAAHRAATRAGLKIRVTGYVGKYGNGRYNISCVRVLSQSPVVGERRPKGAFVSVIEKECETPKVGPVPPAGTT